MTAISKFSWSKHGITKLNVKFQFSKQNTKLVLSLSIILCVDWNKRETSSRVSITSLTWKIISLGSSLIIQWVKIEVAIDILMLEKFVITIKELFAMKKKTCWIIPSVESNFAFGRIFKALERKPRSSIRILQSEIILLSMIKLVYSTSTLISLKSFRCSTTSIKPSIHKERWLKKNYLFPF